jgi:hypothetical protein
MYTRVTKKTKLNIHNKIVRVIVKRCDVMRYEARGINCNRNIIFGDRRQRFYGDKNFEITKLG